MVDAPERIWIEQDDCPYFYEESELTEAGSPVTEYVRADLVAELAAENERLREENMAMEMAHAAGSALSRTGAVKVKALEWEERKTRLGTVWWSAPNPLGGLSIEAASESDKIAAQADYERRILSALEPAAPEGRQEAVAWQHIPGCGTDRESKMVSVSEGVFCDPCIAPLVAALNAAGFATVASCCGHGHRPSVIALRDGRELFIAKDFNEARQIDAIFPIDINGNTRPAEQAVTEAMVEAVRNIDAEAPAKEPRDDWTSTDLDEAFYEGKLRGFWEMAVYAREALTAALGAQTPPEGAVTEEWREIKQHVQPRIADGYTAVAISKPGYWLVKGPGPAAALKAAMEAGR